MQKLSITEKISYGLGDTASNIVFQIVINFLLIYYIDVFGITAAAAGTMFLVVRLFDAFTDPIMGALADRTQTRWGRYRPYMLWLAIPYAVIAVFAFTTPDFADGGKLIYAYVTYTLLMTIYTALNIPYSALGGVMTSDPKERVSVQSYRFALAMVGTAIVVASLYPLVNFFGGTEIVIEAGKEVEKVIDPQIGYQRAMMVLGALAAICFFACFAFTTERVSKVDQIKEKQNIFSDIAGVLKNDQWAIISFLTFLLLVGVVMRGGVTPFYIEYYLDSKDRLPLFMLLGSIAGIAGALSTNFVSKFMDKVLAMKLSIIAIIVFNFAMIFVPRDGFVLALVLSMFANYFHMILIPYMFSAVADTVDYGIDKWGKGAMAMSYSGHLLALKIGIAIGGALCAWLLAYYGYVANAEQSERTLTGITYIYGASVALAGVLMLLFFKNYKLDDAWAKQSASLFDENNNQINA